MKWYSVKKYRPPSCTYIFVRAMLVHEVFSSYDRYFVAMIEDFDKIENLDAWEMANGQDLKDIEPRMYEVTHFCIPDPVEIEENQ